MLNHYVIVYFNNILIYSRSEIEHQKYIDNIFEKLNKKELKLSFKKCKFYKIKIKFLEYVVKTQRIRINPIKIISIRK